MSAMNERTDTMPSDLTLRAGRFIPDLTLCGEERIASVEAYLVSLTEELEQLLPLLSRTSGSDAAPNGGEDD